MEAEGVFKAKPEGNFYLLGGAPTDNNAKLLRVGQMKVIQAAVDSGKIKIVGSQWVPEWSADHRDVDHGKRPDRRPEQDQTRHRLQRRHRRRRDSGSRRPRAGRQGSVSGQDADLAAVKRVIAGTQTVTVYKPLKLIASEAAKLAVALIKGDKPAYNAKLNNGQEAGRLAPADPDRDYEETTSISSPTTASTPRSRSKVSDPIAFPSGAAPPRTSRAAGGFGERRTPPRSPRRRDPPSSAAP